MQLQATITEIRESLTTTFASLSQWFDKPAELRAYRPQHGGWTINEILEHIGLTNHYLLILITKATRKALLNAPGADLAAEVGSHVFQREKLADIGRHQSFAWVRPEHMEPTGTRPLPEVRAQLQEQLSQCLTSLDQLKNGEGVLYKTTMSVNDLGKINVYEYLYFLAQHGQRHLTQMAKNEVEFAAQPH
ncbi:DinB family protein [Hymenobacter cellulosivorans]|uniref:DinB family protein n=1 Tax=Hymenobacter cellulosivorans TaxID=2932249 RepID=A0ABY4F2G1_9BACT|nr:DinB family protein [Hymenobacter cellulosivorans]UOQ50857.1 DinB family protein [Hymenobacter cellulosivorans]